MSETEIKNLFFQAFLAGDTLPPDYLTQEERRIWLRILNQIELMELDHG